MKYIVKTKKGNGTHQFSVDSKGVIKMESILMDGTIFSGKHGVIKARKKINSPMLHVKIVYNAATKFFVSTSDVQPYFSDSTGDSSGRYTQWCFDGRKWHDCTQVSSNFSGEEAVNKVGGASTLIPAGAFGALGFLLGMILGENKIQLTIGGVVLGGLIGYGSGMNDAKTMGADGRKQRGSPQGQIKCCDGNGNCDGGHFGCESCSSTQTCQPM